MPDIIQGDNLGDHIATKNLNLAGNSIMNSRSLAIYETGASTRYTNFSYNTGNNRFTIDAYHGSQDGEIEFSAGGTAIMFLSAGQEIPYISMFGNLDLEDNSLVNADRITMRSGISNDSNTLSFEFVSGNTEIKVDDDESANSELYFRVGTDTYTLSTSQFNMGDNEIIRVGDIAMNAGSHLRLNGVNGDSYITESATGDVRIYSDNNQGLRLFESGTVVDVVIGRETTTPPTFTRGYMHIPTTTGTPTATPSNLYIGKTPLVYNSVNDSIYTYSNDSWHQVGAGGGGSGITSLGGLTAAVQTFTDGTFIDVASAAAAHTVDLSATGTPSATTFLRGDNTWAVPAGGGGGITSLNAQTGSTQTFASGSGITVASNSNIHTFSLESSVTRNTTAQTLTNKTLTTPTIASFINATHTHADNANGGQLGLTALSATGTPSATTYLRGDNTWALFPSGNGITSINADTTGAQVIEGGANIGITDVGATHTLNLDRELSSMQSIVFENVAAAPATTSMALYRLGGNWVENIPSNEFKRINFGGEVKFVYSPGSFRLQNNELRFRDNLHMTSTSDNDLRIRIKTGDDAIETEYEFDSVAFDMKNNNLTNANTITANVITTAATGGLTLRFGADNNYVLNATSFDFGGKSLTNAPHNHTNAVNGSQLGLTALTATGTRNSTTYLRGDNTWATLPTDNTGITSLNAQTGSTQTFASGSGITVASNSNIHTFSLENNVTTNTGTQTLTNKTLTTPTIGSFVNALHTHSNNANGGQLGITALSATGTPSATTFLRGDNTWAVPAGGGGGITSLNGLTGSTQTFIGVGNLNIASAGNVHTFSLSANLVTLGGSQTLTNKVLATPTISSFTNATHNHSTTATGGQLGLNALSATGTPSATTFLRGDNTWAVPAGGGGSGITSINTDTTAAQVFVGGTNINLADSGATHTFNLADNLTNIKSITFVNDDAVPGGSSYSSYRSGNNLYHNVPNGRFQILRWGGSNNFIFASSSLRLGGNELWMSDNVKFNSTATNEFRINLNDVNEYEFGATAADFSGNALQNAPHDHTDAEGGGQLIATTALTATGTKDSTTYLRGDNTWATVSGVTPITAGTGLTLTNNVMSITAGIQSTITGLGEQEQDLEMDNNRITLGTTIGNSGTFLQAVETDTRSDVALRTNGILAFGMNERKDITDANPDVFVGFTPLPIAATTGFFRINYMNSAPTGTPLGNSNTSHIPLIYNKADNTLHTHSNGSWHTIGGSSGSGITSLNSQTGSTQTFASGSGITVASNSNIHTFSLESSVVTTTGAQTLSNKVLTTPTISSFTDATHNHSTTATGGQIGLNALTATGTPSATTYLRGDNTWATVSGGGTPISAGTGLTLSNNVMSVTAGVQSTITGLGQQTQNLDMLDSNILFNAGAGNASISTDVNGYLAFNVPTTTHLIRFTVNNQTRLSISNAIISTPVGLYVGSTNGISFGNNTRIHHAGNQLDLDVNTVPGITIFNASSSTVPDVAIGSLAVLPLTANTGFLHIPTMAGAPTGTPTIRTGKVPLVYDTANNQLYIYSGGQWRSV